MSPSHSNGPLHNFFLRQPEQQKQMSLPNYTLFSLISKPARNPPPHISGRLDTRCRGTSGLGFKLLLHIALTLASPPGGSVPA